MFQLAPHGPDVYVGSGPSYPWNGLYGGQIVAQALAAAAATVESDQPAHSLRAYFIRRGDDHEPVRYEVDRIRNGRSFSTRRVVARQAIGAILNLEASFQRAEPSRAIQTVTAPAVPGPEQLVDSSWSPHFSRRTVTSSIESPDGLTRDPAAGRVVAWMRVDEPIGDLADPAADLLHRCWLAYLSDDLASDSVWHAHPDWPGHPNGDEADRSAQPTVYGASLDHTVWFHQPARIDEWHLHDFTCHGFFGGRGLTVGHVFAADGAHVATVAQEFLGRFGSEPRA